MRNIIFQKSTQMIEFELLKRGDNPQDNLGDNLGDNRQTLTRYG
ncbi:hypothetical protein H1P_5490002 [Hyella patelloides LEGE 07179]|uniref:Uncharacterized protein n=1 Tax=Hyella patelloides LEGE 07179 TaxID=945734 RepID=A0A563W080_9CYAN|nr:hypothetical protein H1P_5490002 [Hyella patelloides LEGE 07179]